MQARCCIAFAVENFSSQHDDRGTAVGTDQQLKWNQPRRESMPVRIAELDYRHNKDKPGKQACTSFKPVSTVDNAAILKIREKIVASCMTSRHNAIVLTSVLPPPPKNTPPSIPELCARFHSSDEESIVAFISQATSDEHLDYFRSLSQDDEEWLDARKGRITASIAADVRSLRDTSEGKTVIQRVMGTAPRIQTKAMAYGHAHESVAQQLYTSEMDKHHKDFECKTTGLHLLPEAPFLGASPDGISSCACHAKRVVEIKCTLKHKNLSVAEIPEIDPSYHLESCNEEVRLKETSSWYFQAQQQMGVLAFDKCDFVIYTRKGIHVIDIPFNRALWESLKDKATHVFCKRIAPLLVK